MPKAAPIKRFSQLIVILTSPKRSFPLCCYGIASAGPDPARRWQTGLVRPMSLDRSARDVLKLRGETAIAWAVFDPVWYLQSYPEASRRRTASQRPCWRGISSRAKNWEIRPTSSSTRHGIVALIPQSSYGARGPSGVRRSICIAAAGRHARRTGCSTNPTIADAIRT